MDELAFQFHCRRMGGYGFHPSDQIEPRADCEDENVEIDWLGQIIVSAGLPAGQLVAAVSERSQKQEWRSRKVRTGAANLFQKLQAIGAGHQYIADDDVGRRRVQHAQRFACIGRADSVETRSAQFIDQFFQNMGFVLDAEDGRHGEGFR